MSRRKRLLVCLVLFFTGLFGSVVHADQSVNKPRVAHFEDFTSLATKDAYVVVLYSDTARCESNVQGRTAQCNDPTTGWRVRFSSGCREVSGEGACVSNALLMEVLEEGGVTFQLACPAGTSLAGTSFLLKAPAGSTCRSTDGRSVECFAGLSSTRGATLVTATCTDGCGEDQDPASECRMCPEGDCR